MIQKIRLVFVPFLIIAIGFIGLYTFLNWFFFIRSELFSVKEDILNFALPLGLPWVFVLIWLRPRIKLLSLKTRTGDLPSLYIFVATFAIAIPAIIAQKYIASATGKLTNLYSIAQIGQQERSKYYILKKHFTDKQHIGIYKSTAVSGRSNETLTMHIYIALPLFESVADTTSSACSNWMGFQYNKSISNRLPNEEKAAQFKEFADESQEDFDNKDFDEFVYLERIGNTDAHDKFTKALKTSPKFGSESNTVFSAIDEPFDERNGNRLAWIFGSLGIGAVVWLIMVLIPSLDKNALKASLNGRSTENNEIKELLKFFIPKEGFYITPIVIDLNLIIFITMVIAGFGFVSFNTHDLLNWGANYRPYTTNGQWWRLLTSTFLHGGAMHVLANMYALLFVGIFLEPLLGRTKYVASYLVTGILASIASLWWHPATVSVGASGAIFGLYGIFLALLLTKVFPKDFSKAFLISTFIFIGYNLLMGSTGGIDNAAHLGGLISGLVIGFYLAPSLKRKTGHEMIEE